ncbi:olfactory receptor 14A16-like [Vombatus ursinus]|uniref:olfactory receptor 14A16-like n=1 Tax=Vombatus ursinus TaxID=29139 RepID=UPI000FFD3AA6|nr:olfactory receptor 14A16-like [Vombatus ursinus]
MNNLTMVTGFLLMGFSNTSELQVLYAMLFLMMYLVVLMMNLLIFTLISFDEYLNSPMYFFLKSLSFLDLCFISTTLPKSITNFLCHSRSIPFMGCILQYFLVIFFAESELSILTIMSYDRYGAICQPLHYEVIMTRGTCVKMATVSWLSGGLLGALYSGSTFTLPFCGSKEINQFFCDVPSLLRLSCSDIHIGVDVTLSIGITFGILCFTSIAISYGHIFSTVLKIPATEDQSKTFSTCMPHLIVLIVFITTGVILYLKPRQESYSVLHLLLSIFYTVVPPTLNPVMYSLRNNDIKTSLMKLIAGKHFSQGLTLRPFP